MLFRAEGGGIQSRESERKLRFPVSSSQGRCSQLPSRLLPMGARDSTAGLCRRAEKKGALSLAPRLAQDRYIADTILSSPLNSRPTTCNPSPSLLMHPLMWYQQQGTDRPTHSSLGRVLLLSLKLYHPRIPLLFVKTKGV